MTYLCDTNILSELARPAPAAAVVEWARTVTRVAISAITVEEIAYGLAWRPNPRVERWFEEVLTSFCEVLPVTGDVAGRAGRLRGSLQLRGATRTQADMMIAATAQAHGLTLVTRNARDFEGCGISVLDPFLN